MAKQRGVDPKKQETGRWKIPASKWSGDGFSNRVAEVCLAFLLAWGWVQGVVMSAGGGMAPKLWRTEELFTFALGGGKDWMTHMML